VLYLIGYILCGVFSLILTYFASNEYSVPLVLFMSIAFAATFYSVITIKQTRHIYAVLFNNKLIYLKLLCLTSIVWWFTFFLNKTVSPTFLELIFGYTPSFIAVFIEWKNTKHNHYRNILFAFIMVGVLIASFLFNKYPFFQSCLIIIYVFIFGLSFVWFSHVSSTIHKELNLSVSAVLAVRFWLLLIILLIYVLINHPNYVKALSSEDFYGRILYISVFLCIIPIFLYQKAMEKLGANKSLILLSASPIIVYIGEMLYKTGSATDVRLLIAAITMFIITIFYKLMDNKNEKKDSIS
jgi:drug/metabolite transporter (DMT)-like permease